MSDMEQDARKAVECLYLAVPSSVADDVKQKVLAAIGELKTALTASANRITDLETAIQGLRNELDGDAQIIAAQRQELTASAQALEDMRVNYCAALDELKASAQRVEALEKELVDASCFMALLGGDSYPIQQKCIEQREQLQQATAAVEEMRGLLERWKTLVITMRRHDVMVAEGSYHSRTEHNRVVTMIEKETDALIAQHPAGDKP